MLKAGSEVYVGQTLDDHRHGRGALLTYKASTGGDETAVLHVGEFVQGLREGAAVVCTSRGETFAGRYADDVPWGPGCYSGASAPAAGGEAAAAVLRHFKGMFNGMPKGQGQIIWRDGRQQAGLFNGSCCYQALDEAQVMGVAVLADGCGQAAVEMAHTIRAELQQQPDIWQHAAAMFAAVPWAAALHAAVDSEQPPPAASQPPPPAS